jgi:MATE family multidrug resistance protein
MFSKFLAEARLTLALAVPIMAGQVSQMVMGLLDSAMVGRVGVTPLAASAFANNVVSVPFVFGIGLLTCLSVRVSQSQGAGDHRESGEHLRHGLVLAGIMGAILTGLVWWLSFHLGSFGQNEAVAVQARPFLLMLGWSIIPAMIGLGIKQFCEALGNPWPPTLILLAAVPLNVVLNWIFIYGNLGAAPLGLEGAGLSTLLARSASCCGMIVYALCAAKIRPSLPARWLRRFEARRFTSLLAIGVPASLQILLEVGAFSMGAILVGRLGIEALAAHQIALSCISTIFMLPLGIAIATTIRIGQALGSGELTRVRSIGYSSFGLSLAVMMSTALILWGFGTSIAGAFVSDPAVARLAAKLLAVAAVFQLCDGLQVVSAGALRGLSDATFPMIVCFCAYWSIGLPLGYYAAFTLKWGPVGIWWGFAIGLFIVASLLVGRFIKKSSPTALAPLRCQPQQELLSVH